MSRKGHKGNEVEREFPEGRWYRIEVSEAQFRANSAAVMQVWATNPVEALSVATGVAQTDYELYWGKS